MTTASLPKRAIDETGNVYGMLMVIDFAGVINSRACWRVKCECGSERIVVGKNLRSGNTTTCGNHKVAWNKKYSESDMPLYKRWQSMIARCNDQHGADAEWYYNKRISVCERWKTFENFRNDMQATFKPELSIERIDNSKGYSKDNCIWTNAVNQARNRDSNITIALFGKTQTVTEWCEELNVPEPRTYYRLKKGWCVTKALLLPKVK